MLELLQEFQHTVGGIQGGVDGGHHVFGTNALELGQRGVQHRAAVAENRWPRPVCRQVEEREAIDLFIVGVEAVPEAEWWAMAPPGLSIHAARQFPARAFEARIRSIRKPMSRRKAAAR